MIRACNTSTQVTEAGELPGVQDQTMPTCKGRKEGEGEKGKKEGGWMGRISPKFMLMDIFLN